MLIPAEDVPVYINNFNRLSAMRQMIEWLLSAGTKRVIILDNASTYPPLLEYYKRLPSGVELRSLGMNCGPWAFWEKGMHHSQSTPYVVADADLAPEAECPKDLIYKLMVLLHNRPESGKVGPGLMFPGLFDNLPGWGAESERRFWDESKRYNAEAFFAPIDTTFALYPARSGFCNWDFADSDHSNLRMDRPYVVRHTPSYFTKETLTDEEKYYFATSNKQWAHSANYF